jgi:superfamily II DNA or RNA helicase
MFQLRDYQQAALDAIDASRTLHNRVAVVLPTGSGKTVIFAHLVNDWSLRNLTPVLILVHRDELVRQTVAKLRAIVPELSVGVVKAERNDVDAAVIVASVQTLSRQSRLDQLPPVSLVIVDEAHHAVADSYLRVLRHAGCFEGRAFAVGFTATLMRADDKGLAEVWQAVAYQRGIIEMISEGHLVDVRGLSVPVDLDLDTVKRSGGDWQAGALADELDVAMVPAAVADAYAEHAADRTGVLFAPTVESAHSFADALNAKNITAETVHGDMSTEERQLIYKRLRHGACRVVTNCAVLTEGWDEPSVSCCVVARPTSSTGLYIQMVGRVLRPFPAGGKTDALVLDVTGASRRHSLADLGALLPSGTRPDDEISLLEQFAEEQTEPARRKRLIEQAHLEQVDLFAGSRSMWLQTDQGVWFVPCGAGMIFLAERDDGYLVGRHTREYGARRVTQDAVPIELAMSVGEQAALDWDPTIASKNAAWRKRRQPATEKQLVVLGDAAYDGITKRDASNLISVKFASRTLRQFAPTKG